MDEEYKKYVKDEYFEIKVFVKEQLKETGGQGERVIESMMDKAIQPYHFWKQEQNGGGSSDAKPTEKQIKFAKQLEIENPESYTKSTLATEIDKKLAEEKK